MFHQWKWKSISCVRLSVTSWTVQSMEFSRPEYWSGLPFPSAEDLPNPRIERRSPALQEDSLPVEPPGKPQNTGVDSLSLLQGIFLTQGSNLGLLHYRQILYHLSHQGSLYLEWFYLFFNPPLYIFLYCLQYSSVAQSYLTLCNPMNRSTPGLPVHHHLPEFTQTHVHWVGDAIQPSRPLSSPSPPAPNPSQHQSLFQWVNSSHEVAKVLEFQL